MIRKVIIKLALLFSCCIGPLQGNHFYSEYWQKFFWKMWENDTFALGTYIKIDTGNQFKSVRSFQFNEELLWKVSENFSLELHYAYIHGRTIEPKSPWLWQYRFELEANRTFRLPHDCLIVTRNRLEIRWVKTEHKTLYRLRQRTTLVIPLEDMGRLKSYSLHNEIFYNVSIRYFTQNRFCPFQLTFALSDTLEMDLFFLLRICHTNNLWLKSAVLGTQFSF